MGTRNRSLAPEPVRYRTVFISDVHLGTRNAQTPALLDFLRHFEADTIYLVGDIFDFWKAKRGGGCWPQGHNDVVQKLLRKARKGARIVFIPGNHDEELRKYAGSSFGSIEIVQTATHVTAAGKTYLVIHGDDFDLVIRNAAWLATLGDIGYDLAMWANAPVNWIRRRLGLGFWSLSAFLKYRVKRAVNFIGAFEDTLAAEATRGGYDGVICGHIHHAADRRIGTAHYLNCGDWVESCTALVETYAGNIEIVRWNDRRTCLQKPEARAQEAPALVAR